MTSAAQSTFTDQPLPADLFKEYFEEKLWEMIPAVYRHEDGLGDHPGVLRALVEAMARQAVHLRRSSDRLWEDQFIEWCDDWAMPYIAELVGTRLVSQQNPRGMRAAVAKSIYYRLRSGTLGVLEELIGDITGWEGTVVEQFRRLGRMRHRLDPPPARLAGRFTGTPPGGLADLRNTDHAALAGGPFDEYHHTPDVRRHRGVDGRYAIPKLAFHVYRLRAFSVAGVSPWNDATFPTRYRFDPSGRDVPLFARRHRGEPARLADGSWDWHRAEEWELPAPIRCRQLGYWKSQLIPESLSPYWKYTNPLTTTVTDVAFDEDKIAAGNLVTWSSTVAGLAEFVVDPERGRLLALPGALPSAPPAVDNVAYHYGFAGEIGAGAYDRPEMLGNAGSAISGGGVVMASQILNVGIAEIEDSLTYGQLPSKNHVEDLTLRASAQQRPYIRLTSNWTLSAGVIQNARLRLDGLWIGSDTSVTLRIIATAGTSTASGGNYECVTLRHMTLDPGGLRTADSADGQIAPVTLEINAFVELLVIESSILGPIRVVSSGNGLVERIVIKDSIIQSGSPSGLAIDAPQSGLELERVTVMGAVKVKRMTATEALMVGPVDSSLYPPVDVSDNQTGCFRFGAALAGSRIPQPYESHVIAADRDELFTSRRFGDPGYGQLSNSAPIEILTGAENGSEIGAFSGLNNPIKRASLEAKIEEYMPFGRIAIVIYET